MSEEIRLPEHKDFMLSTSPHIHVGRGVRSIMIWVIIALAPAMAASIYFWGWSALKVLVLTTLFCVFAELLWCLLARKSWRLITDGSAALTGVLLAMNLSSGTSWWICLIGAFLAIWLGKQIYGGLGHNPFNPALVARVALLIAFPSQMSYWIATDSMTSEPNSSYASAFVEQAAVETQELDSVAQEGYLAKTCATPLSVVAATPKLYDREEESKSNFNALTTKEAYWNYAIGNKGGCLGEVSVLALLAGGILLLALRIIKWTIPVFFIGTVFVITGVINFFYPGLTPPASFHMLTGGLVLGAFFMATDMVTTPITRIGQIWFGIGCGVITAVIRIWGMYPEGVSFSILLMNSLVPLLDRMTPTRPFGYVRKK